MFSLAPLAAGAVVPEQMPSYVEAVSASRGVLCGGFVAYASGDSLVLVAYPQAADPAGPEFARRVDAAVAEALARPQTARLTVLAPLRPSAAPAGAPSTKDMWWALPLPFRNDNGEAPGAKLRNMLRRAARDLETTRDVWSAEHAAVAAGYLRSRVLSPGTRRIFGALRAYAAAPGTLLLSARRRGDGALQAFVLGDLSAFSTAFYMFAFRDPGCPPGGSDLLLAALADEAAAAGHTTLNLGLGINSGITFFKRKWNARPLLPYVETTWSPAGPERRGGLLRRLFGGRGRGDDAGEGMIRG